MKLSARDGHRRVALPLADRSVRVVPMPYRWHGGDVTGWGVIDRPEPSPSSWLNYLSSIAFDGPTLGIPCTRTPGPCRHHATLLSSTHVVDNSPTRSPFSGRPPKVVAYRTKYGRMLKGTAEELLSHRSISSLRGKINLIFTSPPFPLNKKKQYGNLLGDHYVEWIGHFADRFHQLLTRDGSLVIELGNAWEPRRPVMSTLALRALLKLQQSANFHLCQEIIWHNPARLPSPAQWVTVERIRLKDSYTRFWWLSPTERPKADNRRVLREYSPRMQELLKRRSFNPGVRPSQHNISTTGFLVDNGGAISPNVLTIPNTRSNDRYQVYCRKYHLQPHPARMPPELADFFLRFLTDEGDIVLDPFSGSNTTGAAAEALKRYWISIEPRDDYILSSRGRFSGICGLDE